MGYLKETAIRYRRGEVDREVLAGAIRDVSVAYLAGRFDLPPVEREDVAHEVTMRVLPTIMETGCTPGAEDGYVRRCVHNGAIDWYRKYNRFVPLPQGEDGEDMDLRPGQELLPVAPPPGEAEAARQIDCGKALDELKGLVSEAPKNYRLVLTGLYIQGLEIEDLVQIKLGLPRNKISKTKWNSTRNTLYQHKLRAMNWFLKKLATRPELLERLEGCR